MNPNIDPELVREAYEADPENAAAEYGAEFRSDIAGYIDRAVVEALMVPGRIELPRMADSQYQAFVDPSGGHRDSFTLAIAHAEGQTGVLDLIREVKAPFDPSSVVAEFAGVLRQYGITEVTGDKYGGDWPSDRFADHAIRYNASERAKSQIYQEFLPLLNSRKLELLDSTRMLSQFCGLERRTARGGRDSVDHSPGAHDDVANAVAGVLVLVAGQPDLMEWARGVAENIPAWDAWFTQQERLRGMRY
jgi:hypothetical protein